jgi:ParB/RepB/Spo0J family partition protein
MATAPVRKKLELRGISADAMETARANFQSMAAVIEIPIRGGKVATFTLVVVPSDDIESKTYVAGENGRNQKLLNKVSVSDISPTIKASGQQFPAFGQWDNDLIKVIDGSRRRFTCKAYSQPYYIYVTSDPIERADVRYISQVANISKGLSLYEKGSTFAALLDYGTYADNKSLAEGEGEHESTVSIAISSFRNLPVSVAERIPSISDIGRSLMKELIDLSSDTRLSVEQRTGLIDTVLTDEFSLDQLIAESGSEDPTVLNNLFIKKYKAAHAELLPKAKEKTPAPILASKGNTQAVIAKSSKRGFTVQINCTDAKVRAAIEAAIQKAIEGK